LFVLWLLLWFGRPTWGALLDLMPLSQNFYFHRLGSGVHLAAIYLMGIGLAAAVGLVRSFGRRLALPGAPSIFLAGSLGAIALLLLPAYRERQEYFEHNGRLIAASRDAFEREQKDIDALFSAIDN